MRLLMAAPLSGLPLYFFAALLVWIIYSGTIKQKRLKAQRAPALAGMGFTEVTPELVFGGNAKAVARSFTSYPGSHVSSWVGKGQTAVGETLIFAVDERVDSNSWRHYTVVAFHVPNELPDFEVRPAVFFDRFARHDHASQSAVPPQRAVTERSFGPFKLVSQGEVIPAAQRIEFQNETFAKKYVVTAHDENATRRVLGLSFPNTLGSSDVDLVFRKSGDWLFVHRNKTSPVAPEEYPATLQEAVKFASYLNLRKED